MRTLAAAALLAALSAPAAALEPAVKSALADAGLKPDSPEVLRVADDAVDVKTSDGIEKVSMRSLAAKRDLEGLRRWVATRNFIRAFKMDRKTEYPKDGLYNGRFLAKDEQALVAASLKEEWSRLGRKG